MKAETTPDVWSEDPDGRARIAFIVEMGTLATAYGVSSHRLQAYLERLAQLFDLEEASTATPRSITFVLWLPGAETQVIRVVPAPASSFDMARLAEVSALMDDLEAGAITLAAARQTLEAIDGRGKRPPRYGPFLLALGYALSGAGFAVLLSAAWWNVLGAALASLLVYGLTCLGPTVPALQRRLNLAAGFAVALLADGLARVVPGGDPVIITVCGLVVLLPGYALTLGVAELSAGMTLSGLQRIVAGVMTLLYLFIGAVLATLLLHSLFSLAPPTAVAGRPGAWAWLFAGLLTAGLAPIYQVRPLDFAWAILGGLLAYAGTRAGADFGYWQGAFLGAIAIGLYANLFAKNLRRPASIVLVPAIMVLVPGAGALLGLQSGATEGAAQAVSAEWHTLANIAAIIAGLMTANALIPAKSTL